MAKKQKMTEAKVKKMTENALTHYKENLRESVESGDVQMYIILNDVPKDFSIRHVKYRRPTGADYEKYTDRIGFIFPVTESDIKALGNGKTASRLNYGVTPADSRNLASDLNSAAAEIAALKRQLAAKNKPATKQETGVKNA